MNKIIIILILLQVSCQNNNVLSDDDLKSFIINTTSAIEAAESNLLRSLNEYRNDGVIPKESYQIEEIKIKVASKTAKNFNNYIDDLLFYWKYPEYDSAQIHQDVEFAQIATNFDSSYFFIRSLINIPEKQKQKYLPIREFSSEQYNKDKEMVVLLMKYEISNIKIDLIRSIVYSYYNTEDNWTEINLKDTSDNSVYNQ